MKIYFVYEPDLNNPLSSILKKYYNKWKENIEDSVYRNMYTDFMGALALTNQEIDSLTANVYHYGFTSNSPYEILISGNYGGIVGEYLKSFSDFSNVEFNFTKYNSYKSFKKALNNSKVDIYFDYYNIPTNYISIDSMMPINFVIIAPIENNIVINSLEALRDQEVYVLESSPVIDSLKNISNIKIIWLCK